MVIKAYIGSVRIVIRSDDPADVGHVRDARKLLDAAPVFAAIFADVQDAVVGTDIKQSLFLLRLSDRGGVAEESSRRVLRHRVDAPDSAHHRQLVAIEIARELTADY